MHFWPSVRSTSDAIRRVYMQACNREGVYTCKHATANARKYWKVPHTILNLMLSHCCVIHQVVPCVSKGRCYIYWNDRYDPCIHASMYTYTHSNEGTPCIHPFIHTYMHTCDRHVCVDTIIMHINNTKGIIQCCQVVASHCTIACWKCWCLYVCACMRVCYHVTWPRAQTN